MKKLFLALLPLAAAAALLLVPFYSVSASPVDVFQGACSGSSDTAICKDSSGSGLFGVIKSIIQVMLVISGIIAVIMIIVGGIRYSVSHGDQSHIKAAKDTILYSVVGLVVSIAAFAIVTWVIGRL